MKLEINPNEYLPLREVVFKTLRNAIIKGEFMPGERLMEEKIAANLGVSRTPVREAIRMLELEGLVAMIPRKGAEVAKITVKDLRDALEVRMALEELSVVLACERITEEQKKILEKTAEGFRRDQVWVVEKTISPRRCGWSVRRR
jgi:DNA-binding GntR family transcriptional regulator